MQKTLFLSAALAAGLMFAGSPQPAEAAPLAPPPAPGATHGALVQDAAWSCGPRRCVWVPGYRGPVPGYARAWTAPLYPNCYWKRGLLGNWRQKCDR
ncbi:MAG TPA: hypothetical protein VMW05_06360 [Methyloceanibacter sp.]|nr:hypothetical protein [Methyloceanibacter sp.]